LGRDRKDRVLNQMGIDLGMIGIDKIIGK